MIVSCCTPSAAFRCWMLVAALAGIALVGVLPSGIVQGAEAVDFQREVRPLLAAHCLTCHGPDEAARQADLRLDQREDAVADRGGYAVIVPGDHRASELWRRVAAEDEDLRMPPAGPHPPLSPEGIATLARWINAGAAYQPHWAFVPPRAPDVPLARSATGTETAATAIDAFINRRLAEAGLQPAPPADRYALVRRVYLDLIGIPPTPQQADAFAHDTSPMAYPRLVDHLLSMPEYAERWARPWLDLARYADTNGYEKDRPRTIWPYRDWVLDALGQDMPYDAFSIRQLAGDMLPEATLADQVATGFHRNTMLNEEGGIDPQEYRFHALTDRVATTGTVWMGLTIGCAQCHTHKYDPITHTDYYAFFALLNGADDVEREVTGTAADTHRQQRVAEIQRAEDALIAKYLAAPAGEELAGATGDTEPLRSEVRAEFQRFTTGLREQALDWQVVVPQRMESTLPRLRGLSDGSILASGDVTKRDVYTLHFAGSPRGELPSDAVRMAIRLEVLPHASLPAGGPGLAFYEGRRGDFFLSELRVTQANHPLSLRAASASYGKISIGSGSADAANVIDGEGSTGWSTSGAEGTAHRWVANFDQPLRPSEPWSIEMIFERHYAAPLGRFRISLATLPPGSSAKGRAGAVGPGGERLAVALPVDAVTEADLLRWQRQPKAPLAAESHERLQRQFLDSSEALREVRGPLQALRDSLPEPVRTLVLQQRPPSELRTTHRYHRGEFLQPREPVQPAIPTIFASAGQPMPQDRYELAQWLVGPDNPLFARVAVDRAWRELMGRGIVDTAGDYGTQSEPPSHPQLLDHLATGFVRDGMSLKRLHRKIVMSAAYRRDSRGRSAALVADPDNRLYSVGPRRRLEGERIRDSFLAAAGLLTRSWGGASVFPPQPASVTAAAWGNFRWNESTGADRYRRSLYTFAKRTAPFAALSTFDGPTGETCLPRREVSNSPLQALTLLNDAMFLEIAQTLADEVLRDQPDPQPRAVAVALFRRLLTRPPREGELTAILAFHGRLEAEPQTAWMLVARALMNLDEAITTP